MDDEGNAFGEGMQLKDSDVCVSLKTYMPGLRTSLSGAAGWRSRLARGGLARVVSEDLRKVCVHGDLRGAWRFDVLLIVGEAAL